MNAGREFLAFVDFNVTDNTFVANVAFTCVRIYLQKNVFFKLDAELLNRESSAHCVTECAIYSKRTSKAFF